MCWLPLEDGLIAAFATPALLVTAVNCGFLVVIIRKFLKLKTNQDKSEIDRVKASVRAVAILIPLLGLTCIFGVLQFGQAATAFAYLFVFCNGLQGVFIFITQCLLDDDVKVFLKQKTSRGRVDQSNMSNSTCGTDAQ
ncbi:adhesion G-protein coupled receptor D1-like [Amphiura filiformis]|uniref:adhesion G-protein coupled receptor D1-like n=1 Tax=Amphiura filiformis TaxID=82378 RepID=UPI003B211742